MIKLCWDSENKCEMPQQAPNFGQHKPDLDPNLTQIGPTWSQDPPNWSQDCIQKCYMRPRAVAPPKEEGGPMLKEGEGPRSPPHPCPHLYIYIYIFIYIYIYIFIYIFELKSIYLLYIHHINEYIYIYKSYFRKHAHPESTTEGG